MKGPPLLSPAFGASCEAVSTLSAAESSEAVAAVHRSTIAWLEGNFTVLATLSTQGAVHLSTLESIAVGLLRPAGSTTREAALGLVRVSLGVEEFLLLCGEHEVRTTINALKGLVCETHRMTSFR